MLEAKKSPLLVAWDQLPRGKWEWLVFLMIAKGVTEHRHIYKELCEENADKNCDRRVREALASLKAKGLVYRKKRYQRLHSYLTSEGKILHAKICESCQPA